MPRSDNDDLNSAVTPYARPAVALHWAIALLLFAEPALGWWMPGVSKSPRWWRRDPVPARMGMPPLPSA